ncbi:hypothetical protein MJO29_005955 [Puccinia striiformis f. sp. tritici]|nr:hypothetical protein MJO29_005955 [Puccinia striiformis f. sp. tritici]
MFPIVCFTLRSFDLSFLLRQPSRSLCYTRMIVPYTSCASGLPFLLPRRSRLLYDSKNDPSKQKPM